MIILVQEVPESLDARALQVPFGSVSFVVVQNPGLTCQVFLEK